MTKEQQALAEEIAPMFSPRSSVPPAVVAETIIAKLASRGYVIVFNPAVAEAEANAMGAIDNAFADLGMARS